MDWQAIGNLRPLYSPFWALMNILAINYFISWVQNYNVRFVSPWQSILIYLMHDYSHPFRPFCLMQMERFGNLRVFSIWKPTKLFPDL
jgi:type IV secretory pathway VirB3-like protein